MTEDLVGFSGSGLEVLLSSSDKGCLGDVSGLEEEISSLLGISLRHLSILNSTSEAAVDFIVVELAISVGVAGLHDIGGRREFRFHVIESDGGSSGNKSEEFHVV